MRLILAKSVKAEKMKGYVKDSTSGCAILDKSFHFLKCFFLSRRKLQTVLAYFIKCFYSLLLACQAFPVVFIGLFPVYYLEPVLDVCVPFIVMQ